MIDRTTRWRRTAVAATAALVLAGALLVAPLHADDDEGDAEPGIDLEALDLAAYEPLLARGELTLVETEDDGALRFVTVLALVDAPPEAVLDVITDYDSYASFMPRTRSARVLRRRTDEVEIELEIEAPGPNLISVQRHKVDRAALAVDVRTVSGDMKGGVSRWRLRRLGERTVVAYGQKAQMGGLGSLLRSFDDEHRSLDFGINVSAAVLVLRAVKEQTLKRRPAGGPGGKKRDY